MRSYRSATRIALKNEILEKKDSFAEAKIPFSAAKAVLTKYRKFITQVNWAGYTLDESTARLEKEMLIQAGPGAFCCAKCGALIKKDQTACPECMGIYQVVCSHCHSTARVGTEKCGNCGQRLDEAV